MPRAEAAPGPERPGLRAAALFAALGDPTRLSLLGALSGGAERSISALAAETGAPAAISRQGLTKHLDVMEAAGLVTRRRVGRESRVCARREVVDEARAYLDRVSAQWDDALGRLKRFVEE